LKIVARYAWCCEVWRRDCREADFTVTYYRIAYIKASHPPGRNVKLHYPTKID
jgi:hypothetical protein